MSRQPPAREETGGIRRDLIEGFAYVRAHAWLWATLAGAALFLLVTYGPMEVLLPYIIKNELGGDAATFGTVLAVGGLGSIAAAVLLSITGLPRRHVTFMWSRLDGRRRSWTSASRSPGASWQMCVLAFFSFGLATAGLLTWSMLMYTLVPGEMLGRVSSLDWFVSIGLTPVSFALTGPIADAFGARETLAGAGILGLFTVRLPVHPGRARPRAHAASRRQGAGRLDLVRLRLATVAARGDARARRPGGRARPGPLDPHRLQLGVELLLAGRELAAGSAQRLLQRAPAGALPDRAVARRAGRARPGDPAGACWRAEGYNHVGDISWDRAEGGRVLLPLECFTPGAPNGGNTCGTGSIGVADPATLAFRYYVKLDPAADREGDVGRELARRHGCSGPRAAATCWPTGPSDVRPARAAPAGAPLRAVRRLRGAVPPSGVTGAAFRGGRLLPRRRRGHHLPGLVGRRAAAARAGSSSSCRTSRARRRGCTRMRLMNGELHWLIAPLAVEPTFPPSVALLHFTRGARPARADG